MAVCQASVSLSVLEVYSFVMWMWVQVILAEKVLVEGGEKTFGIGKVDQL